MCIRDSLQCGCTPSNLQRSGPRLCTYRENEQLQCCPTLTHNFTSIAKYSSKAFNIKSFAALFNNCVLRYLEAAISYFYHSGLKVTCIASTYLSSFDMTIKSAAFSMHCSPKLSLDSISCKSAAFK
eukprot:TRINITY_DN823_c0_g1_i14.p2 TRINITY_DN823_c0_g1~~TRINITY_DN823_c0_g1_i14.p2  ORF type:complete len:141 (-),score=0.14 TRINITY_DN823_c0_g1_i14:565-942(-)